jgi:hypothetical protein
MVELLVPNFGNNPAQGFFGSARNNYGLAFIKRSKDNYFKKNPLTNQYDY